MERLGTVRPQQGGAQVSSGPTNPASLVETPWPRIAPQARSVVLLQVFEAHASRSLSASVFGLNPWSNRALLAATVGVLVMQTAVVFLPSLQGLFGTAGLTASQIAILLAAGLFVLLAVEAGKILGRRLVRA